MDLPNKEDVGTRGSWELRSDSRNPLKVVGRFIGWSTSHSSRHTHDWAWCSACRWSDFRIFVPDSGGYVIHYTGISDKPGETTRLRYEEAVTAHEVVEILTTRRSRGDRREVFLSAPAARLLAQAASLDEAVRDAFENRAVL